VKKMPHYYHNKTTLRSLMKAVNIKNYDVSIDEVGGRKRLILYFSKEIDC